MIWNRLLYKLKIIFVQTLNQTNSFFCTPCLVCIYTNLNIITNSLTNCFYSCKIFIKRCTYFSFNCIKTICHMLLSFSCHNFWCVDSDCHICLDEVLVSTKQFVHWHTCFLAKEIIASHINSILCTSGMCCSTIHDPVYFFQISRIYTNEFSLHCLNDIVCTG